MLPVAQITDHFAVTGDVQPEDFAALAAAGFKTVINNRPDGEERGQMSDADARAAAAGAGLSYHYLPVVGGQFTPDQVMDMQSLLSEADGPVLAHCRTGTRCAALWALATAGDRPPEDTVKAAADAGYDLSGLIPTLEHLHASPLTKG